MRKVSTRANRMPMTEGNIFMDVYKTALIDGMIMTLNGTREQALACPFSERVDRRTRHGDGSDVAHAVEAARTAFVSWSQTDASRRRQVIEGLATRIEERADDLAGAISAEVGTPEKIARAVQASLPVHVLRGFAKDLEHALSPESIDHSTVMHRPVGVVAAVTPWNYPLHQAMAKVGAALAAGCTVILKPSELTPRTNALMMEILAECVPNGTVNVVPGDAITGAVLVDHNGVDAVSFTGSVEGGRAVAQAAAKALKPCHLELGGKSAGLVLEDADVEAALKSMVNAGLLNSGQSCNAISRILVPHAMLDATTAKIVALAEKMVSRLGPVISQEQYSRVQGFIARAMQDSSVRMVAGGTGRPEGQETGFFVRPTVFVASDADAEIVQREVFGPVLVIQGYGDDEDLISLANGTDYGLAAALWGDNGPRVDAISARLRAGQIDVNGAPFNPRAPFGGFRLSGSGREMGFHGIREFQRPVSVQK